jgi:hypothetical protein
MKRFESQLSRMNCQTFSTGLSSGDFGGRGRMVMLAGMTSFADRCHPEGRALALLGAENRAEDVDGGGALVAGARWGACRAWPTGG